MSALQSGAWIVFPPKLISTDELYRMMRKATPKEPLELQAARPGEPQQSCRLSEIKFVGYHLSIQSRDGYRGI